MAGMPYQVLHRAEEVLQTLESTRAPKDHKTTKSLKKDPGYQLSFIALDDPLLLDIKDQIMDIDINTLTPVEALMKLNDIKSLLTKKK